jgi:transmembrane sensor
MSERPTPAMVEQAAEWAAQLDDPGTDATHREAFRKWYDEHPLHRMVFDRMGGIDARFERLDRAERNALGVIEKREGLTGRRIAGGLAGLALLVGLGAAANQSYALRSLSPDHRIAVGEQRVIALADGSRLVADTGTRFDGFSGNGERDLLLFNGQIEARVAPDKSRPFVIQTREGTATAVGTVYSVRRENGLTTVTVIESRVRLCPASAACRTLAAGERATMSADGIGPIQRVDPELADLWTTGWIEAHDRPVAQLLIELSRYRAAPIHFDAQELAGLRVTGSYPLKDPEATLRSIAGATGLRMTIDAEGVIRIARPRG